MANPNNASWSSGLCGCTHDVGSCCLTLFCPCIVFGRIAEIVDKGATSCCKSGTAYTLLASATGLGGCLYSCGYRSRLREQYGLEEKPCGDCCVHWFCEPCALCQEYRELQTRGFDMALGWQGNMERMGKSGATAAPQTHPAGDDSLVCSHVAAQSNTCMHCMVSVSFQVKIKNISRAIPASIDVCAFLLKESFSIPPPPPCICDVFCRHLNKTMMLIRSQHDALRPTQSNACMHCMVSVNLCPVAKMKNVSLAIPASACVLSRIILSL